MDALLPPPPTRNTLAWRHRCIHPPAVPCSGPRDFASRPLQFGRQARDATLLQDDRCVRARRPARGAVAATATRIARQSLFAPSLCAVFSRLFALGCGHAWGGGFALGCGHAPVGQ
eukprot:7385387-Prymnesium_polylepis.2